MTNDEKRVVLIKPGDVLLIGGLRRARRDVMQQAVEVIRKLGFTETLLFTDDIQIDALAAEQVARIAPPEEARKVARELVRREREHLGAGREGHLSLDDLAPLLHALNINPEETP